MKKLYLSISLCFCSILLFAQQSLNINEPESVDRSISMPNTNNSNSFIQTPIWSEDFAGGFPALWSTSSTNMAGAFATCPWAWSTDGTWGYWNGNQGNSPSNAITSTTASNGFLICDTDSANHYANGQPSGSTYQYIESYVTTDAIDLSMYPAVSVEFEHLFRYNNLGNTNFTPPSVYVSSDSINWTQYEVHGGISNNTQSSNPEFTSINISTVAGNQSTVYLRFGWVARCYYWMIDDIKIVETDPNRLEIADHTYGGWWLGYQITGDLGADYTFNPLNQVNQNPYRMEAVVQNNGASSQTNTTLYTSIDDQFGNNIATASSNGMTSLVNSYDTLATNTDFSPTSLGYHEISFWASSDSFPSTDTLVKGTVVTDTVYGLDYDWNTDGTNAGNGYFLGRSCGGQVLANRYDIYENTTVTSISFHVNDNSVPGAELNVELYEAIGQIYLEESDPYVLTAADIDNWVTLPLLNPTFVTAGTSYLAAVRGRQHPTDTSLISSTTNPNTARYLQDNCGNGNWYTISKALLIRMNFGTPNSIIEDKLNLKFKIFPNPSNGYITVQNQNDKSYNISVQNIYGQEIYFEKNINSYEKQFDLNNLSRGVYTIKVYDEQHTFIDKLLIQ